MNTKRFSSVNMEHVISMCTEDNTGSESWIQLFFQDFIYNLILYEAPCIT